MTIVIGSVIVLFVTITALLLYQASHGRYTP